MRRWTKNKKKTPSGPASLFGKHPGSQPTSQVAFLVYHFRFAKQSSFLCLAGEFQCKQSDLTMHSLSIVMAQIPTLALVNGFSNGKEKFSSVLYGTRHKTYQQVLWVAVPLNPQKRLQCWTSIV